MRQQRFKKRAGFSHRVIQLFIGLMLYPWMVFATPKEIIFWHSMAGQLGEEVRALTQKFNQSQADFIVTPVYKGDYIESLTSFATAFRAKKPPGIIQVFEVGTSVLVSPKGVIKPVGQLMNEQGLHFSTKSLLPAVREHYSDAQGQLIAMPFNISVPVLFYNADVLAQFGVTPKSFPRTWDELELLAQRLQNAGFSCAYTTAYPAWILLESYASLHGLTLIDDPEPFVMHIKRLRRWQNHHYFEYGGRSDDSTVLFTSGKCPIFSQSSGGYAGLSALVSFKVGIAPMPLDVGVSEIRHNNVIGGAALWVVANQSSDIQRGVAQFLMFLAKPNIQRLWYEHTGYLPLEMHRSQFLNEERSQLVLNIAAMDLSQDEASNFLLELGPKNKIRTINDQMLEAVFAGILTPEEAMKRAVIRINLALFRFRKNTSL